MAQGPRQELPDPDEHHLARSHAALFAAQGLKIKNHSCLRTSSGRLRHFLPVFSCMPASQRPWQVGRPYQRAPLQKMQSVTFVARKNVTDSDKSRHIVTKTYVFRGFSASVKRSVSVGLLARNLLILLRAWRILLQVLFQRLRGEIYEAQSAKGFYPD